MPQRHWFGPRKSSIWNGRGTTRRRSGTRPSCGLTPKSKAAWVAYAASQCLTAARAEEIDAATTVLVRQLQVDVAAQWRPTVENYFKRIRGTDVLIAIGLEWFGEVWAQKHKNEKKSVLVSLLHSAVNNAATRESLNADVLERIDTWLPTEIRD